MSAYEWEVTRTWRVISDRDMDPQKVLEKIFTGTGSSRQTGLTVTSVKYPENWHESIEAAPPSEPPEPKISVGDFVIAPEFGANVPGQIVDPSEAAKLIKLPPAPDDVTKKLLVTFPGPGRIVWMRPNQLRKVDVGYVQSLDEDRDRMSAVD